MALPKNLEEAVDVVRVRLTAAEDLASRNDPLVFETHPDSDPKRRRLVERPESVMVALRDLVYRARREPKLGGFSDLCPKSF